MATTSPQQIDANFKPIGSNEAMLLESTWTFVGSTTGANGAHTIFTVTDNVWVENVFGICDTDLTASGGAPTISVGTANNTAALLPATTVTNIDDGDVWVDSGPEVEVGNMWNSSLARWCPINDGADIILTISDNTINAGVIDFYVMWRPLNNDSNITVTTPA